MTESPKQTSPDRPPRRSIWSVEAIGVLVIAALILIFILIRYGKQVPWGAR